MNPGADISSITEEIKKLDLGLILEFEALSKGETDLLMIEFESDDEEAPSDILDICQSPVAIVAGADDCHPGVLINKDATDDFAIKSIEHAMELAGFKTTDK